MSTCEYLFVLNSNDSPNNAFHDAQVNQSFQCTPYTHGHLLHIWKQLLVTSISCKLNTVGCHSLNVYKQKGHMNVVQLSKHLDALWDPITYLNEILWNGLHIWFAHSTYASTRGTKYGPIAVLPQSQQILFVNCASRRRTTSVLHNNHGCWCCIFSDKWCDNGKVYTTIPFNMHFSYFPVGKHRLFTPVLMSGV